jgi:hypothetical protein
MIPSVAAGGFFDIASFHAQNVAQGKVSGEVAGHREVRQGGASGVSSEKEEKEGKEEKTASAQVNVGDTATKPNGEPLTEEDQSRIRELESTDRKVRQHEQAHMAAGGGLVTSGASYTYTQGPDGKRYVTGGEVGIDTSEGRTPEETLTRARQIRRAALAPADPSPQDRNVAAAASQMEMQALQEIAQQQLEASKGEEGGAGADAAGIGTEKTEATSVPPVGKQAANDEEGNRIGKSGRNEAAIHAYQGMLFGAAQDKRETRASGVFISAYA